MTWPEIWTSDSLAAQSIRTVLTPASWCFSLGWRLYASVYSLGLKKAKRPHRPVICVGNLVVGGSGKTPIVVFLAGLIRELGHEVVISASGYGSPASEAAQVAPDGPLDPREWGDEPALLREELPEIPLIVGRRRVLAAELCAMHFPNAVMLMDDGVQHLPLARDFSFVVDPPTPNRRCLPAGPYREPALRGDPPQVFRGGSAALIPGDYDVIYSPLEFDPGPPPKKAAILCAIGNPESFARSVADAGVEVTQRKFLPDHDPLNQQDLWKSFPDKHVIVTLKDWVKLRNQPAPQGIEIVVARRSASLEPRDKVIRLLKELIEP